MATWITMSRGLQATSATSRTDHQRTTGTRLWEGRGKATRALGVLQLALPLLLAAQDPGVERLFPATPTNYLTDVAGIVPPAEAGAINDLAARLRAATGAELAVVTLPTIEDQAPNVVATAIGRRWKVGAAGAIGDSTRNAGLVLLLVPRTPDHKGEIYLATGRGIEGIITDATAGRVTEAMLPELRERRWGPALLTGTRAIVAVTARGFGVSDSALVGAAPGASRAPPFMGISRSTLILLLFVAVVVLAIIGGGGGGWRGRRYGRRDRWRGRGGGDYGGTWGGSWGGGFGGGSGWGGGSGGGGFGGFGGGGGFSGGGAGRSF